ncbi:MULTISPECIES: hypothetical protein [Mycolicibacter]|uniref:Uncharacterized protein n=2 Tax=Mycolicibacter TaxID=1073531 RepID=A0ABU5XM59_9MYCO|nr:MULTISPECIES: hypothetical protein [unclassified Mycolicibacter]MEB3023355.1 hypothetical protein [Mycolicibacter sp. MYC098]MEB3033696.1 hypothetical protein [Mycolicibacter sp. MYC340]
MSAPGEASALAPAAATATSQANTAGQPAAPLAPLRVVRDVAGFDAWWSSWEADLEMVQELMDMIDDACEAEAGVSAVLSEVFDDAGPVPAWLRVEGLRSDAVVAWLSLAVDAAYDNSGHRDGAQVTLWVQPELQSPPADHSTALAPGLTVTVYVDKPHRVFRPEDGLSLREAVGAVIDEALYLVNADLAERDKFNAMVRMPA